MTELLIELRVDRDRERSPPYAAISHDEKSRLSMWPPGARERAAGNGNSLSPPPSWQLLLPPLRWAPVRAPDPAADRQRHARDGRALRLGAQAERGDHLL